MKYGKPLLSRIQFIDARIRDGKYPNSRKLAEEYEVSERTIHRDIDYMRDMLGCPIEYNKNKRGYYYAEPFFSLPSVQITEKELFAFCVAEKALEEYRATPLYDTLAKVYKKLTENLTDEITANFSWLNPDISFIQQSTTIITPSIWETISTALYTHSVLDASHRKAGATKSTKRLIEPYHMAIYEGEWYLIGYCRLKKETLIFAISRFESVKRLNETFVKPETFNINEYLGSHFGITRENENYQVKVKFNSTAAPYILERNWSCDQTIDKNKDGSIILTFKSNSIKEVKRWVLSWGSTVEVISPNELVLDIYNELKLMIENYK
ncbi:MAG: transcriptional regulator [Spirochaetes bacterium]|jgi:proteasome accessory factor B|nr:transcriptional regulator [Spirochaetota bacterium]